MVSSRPQSAWRPSSAQATLALLLILGGALLLRLLAAPWTPIHSNTHGIRTIRTLLEGLNSSEVHLLYGHFYAYLMRFLLGLFGQTEATIFTINALFGTASVYVLYALARIFRLSESASLAAAFLLALSPAHIWVSGSEVQGGLYQLLLTSGLVFVLTSIQRSSAGRLWIGALLIGLASILRVITVLAVPIAVWVYLCACWTWRKWPTAHRKHRYLALLVTSWMAFTIFWNLRWTFFAFESFQNDSKLVNSLFYGTTLFDPTLTAPLGILLALVGIVALGARNPRWLFTWLGVLAPLFLSSSLINSYRTDAVRYQAPTHWIIFLMAGVGIHALARTSLQATRNIGAYLAVAVALFVGLHAYWALPIIHKGSIVTREYRFIRTTVQQLSRETTIAYPRIHAPKYLVLNDFPDYLTESKVRRQAEVSPEQDDVLVYIGLNCYKENYLVSDSDEMDGLRLGCEQVCRQGELVPVKTRTLERDPPAVGYQVLGRAYRGDEFTVGFYRCAESN